MASVDARMTVLPDAARQERLLAAKKKLKTFRASRSSELASAEGASSPCTTTKSPAPSPRNTASPLPLTRDIDGNTCHVRAGSRERVEDDSSAWSKAGLSIPPVAAPFGVPPSSVMVESDSSAAAAAATHRRNKSGGRGRHRRGDSSASISVSRTHNRAASTAEPVFGLTPGWSMGGAGGGSGSRLDLPPIPSDIITTPATPLLDAPDLEVVPGPPALPLSEGEEDQHVVQTRLSTFTFGSRPNPASTTPVPSRSPSASPRRTRNPVFPSLGSHGSLGGLFPSAPLGASLGGVKGGSSPVASARDRLSTPSRPPSLLFTSPSPLQPSALPNPADPPATPPPAHRKRHSHTRSSSISMPNLKLAGRPMSLGIPTSPSFPSLPCSPISDSRHSTSVNGTRLKFEPSEAEKEKEEGRRLALEKLTGGSPMTSPVFSEPQAEIALPELDDDTSSIASSRPFSGTFSSSGSFGRPASASLASLSSSTSSSSSSSSPFVWAGADDGSPLLLNDRWSFGLGKDEPFGFALDMTKRGSMTGTLAVLAEEDENVEEQSLHSVESGTGAVDAESYGEPVDMPTSPDVSAEPPLGQLPAVLSRAVEVVGPTPSRLRELHLVSSTPRSTSSNESHGSAARPVSPTKSYGAIGRGRPRPLSGIQSLSLSSNGSTQLTTALVTPNTSSSSTGRRPNHRGSSISYKKDDSVASGASASNRWSIGSRNLASPPPDGFSPVTSPTLSSSSFRSNRPCPRPKSLAGLGLDGFAGSSGGVNRVLSHVSERDEEGASPNQNDGWRSAPAIPKGGFRFQSFSSGVSSHGRRSGEMEREEEWRDEMLELQMERDALSEDVAGWKERCMTAEERLEAEKRETAVLRERVRKLGDRLMTVSSAAPRSPGRDTSQESRLVHEMREQLFHSTAALDKERKDKDAAISRVAELERALTRMRFEARSYSQDDHDLSPSPPTQDSPFVPTPTNAMTPRASPPGAILRLATLEAEHTPPREKGDVDEYRMRAWGFPRGVMGSTLQAATAAADGTTVSRSERLVKEDKTKKRESFFGLSRDIRSPDLSLSLGGQSEGSDVSGVDLPPFVFPTSSPSVEAASAPQLPAATLREERESGGVDLDPVMSTGRGVRSSTSTGALGFIASYLPGRSPSPTKNTVGLPSHTNAPTPAPGSGSRSGSRNSQASRDGWRRVDEAKGLGLGLGLVAKGLGLSGVGLDFRRACRCCSGQVVEV